jgi:hypothetical protein
VSSEAARQTQQPPSTIRSSHSRPVARGERYADFGPTLAAEKLAEHHSCSIWRETLRGSTRVPTAREGNARRPGRGEAEIEVLSRTL